MTNHQITLLLADLALITALALVVGTIARRIRQPAVVGEVIVGVLLGPTILHGELGRFLLPAEIRPLLAGFANFGVVLFIFAVGLELEQRLLERSGSVVAKVTAGSIAVPGLLGAGLAIYLGHEHGTPHRLAFVMFMAAAMSVTAFPVLARILTDQEMSMTKIGQLALTCAALNDVVAWLVLAAAVALSGVAGDDASRLITLVPYVVFMLLVVRPGLQRLAHTDRLDITIPGGATSLVIAGLALSAAATSWMGLHAVFGAFMFGVITPRGTGNALRARVGAAVGTVSCITFLPIYFISAGLQVNFATLDGRDIRDLALIFAVAVGGKMAGTIGGARWSGVGARNSLILAVLMNTRGLTELIVLNVGLQLGILDTQIYSLMVAMAIVTTAIAGPALSVFYPRGRIVLDRQDAAIALGTVATRLES